MSAEPVVPYGDVKVAMADHGLKMYAEGKKSVLDPSKLRKALEAAGFEPDFNVCGFCGHHGSEHDLGNWCLKCPRPEVPASKTPFKDRSAAGWCYFSSMTEDEKWAHGVSELIAALSQ